jgi:hypothetical protein
MLSVLMTFLMTVVAIAMSACLVCAFITFPAVMFYFILIAKRPPTHGSWWYPRPGRWDYGWKLVLYAMVDANTPSDPAAQWFVRGVAIIVLLAYLVVWSQILWRR